LEDNLSVYYNNDIDCNGVVGDLITGLNEKTSPSDIDYACVVGVGNNLPSLSGDGIVAEERADLNNYLLATPPLMNQHADRYDVTTAHTSIHKENHSTIIRGLDEPDVYERAYPIPLNSFNLGFSTEQAPNHPLQGDVDWDDYRITITENGTLTVNVLNIPVHEFAVLLLDESLNTIEELLPTAESNLAFSTELSPGEYFLEIGSIPTSNSWRFPYAYDLFFEPSEPLIASFTANQQEGCAPFTVDFTQQATGGAEAYSWTFEGGTPASSTLANPTVTYEEIGTYDVSLTVSNSNGEATASEVGYINVDTAPEAGFSYENQQGRTISFLNQTAFGLEAPSYEWDFDDGQSSTQADPTHTYEEDGSYTVQLEATNNCGASSVDASIEIVTVNTQEQAGAISILAYPVPADDVVHIEISGPVTGNGQLLVQNQLGQELDVIRIEKVGNALVIPVNLKDQPSGIYYFSLRIGSSFVQLNVVKK